MIRSKLSLHSIFSCLTLAAVFIFTSSQFTANAQTEEKSTSVEENSALVAKTEKAPADPAAVKTSSSRASLPSPSSSNWTGFYAGGYAGFNLGRATANTSTVSIAPAGYFAATSPGAIQTAGRQNLTPNGFTGGGQAGYNYQLGNFVVGAEADFGSLTGNKTVSTTATYPCCSPANFTVTQSVKTRWLFTARPRVGLATENALFYATGGLAVTDLNYQTLFADSFGATESGGVNKSRAGWTGGGGMEYKLGDKWSVKGEYLFTDFRRLTTTSTNLTQGSATFPSNPFTHSIYLKEHNVRFGINYHF